MCGGPPASHFSSAVIEYAALAGKGVKARIIKKREGELRPAHFNLLVTLILEFLKQLKIYSYVPRFNFTTINDVSQYEKNIFITNVL